MLEVGHTFGFGHEVTREAQARLHEAKNPRVESAEPSFRKKMFEAAELPTMFTAMFTLVVGIAMFIVWLAGGDVVSQGVGAAAGLVIGLATTTLVFIPIIWLFSQFEDAVPVLFPVTTVIALFLLVLPLSLGFMAGHKVFQLVSGWL